MLLSTSETTFSKQVLETSEPVVVYFWAPWCKLCSNVSSALAQFQSQHPGRLKMVSINADENFKLVNEYRLKMLPTVLIFERGDVIQRLEGFYKREDLHRRLVQVTQSVGAKVFQA
ncbi:thioredoxin family protein [Oscillatoria sp. FACHB-1406]|uniref:thioredoxin family protein n=1 Tax=Oscillatoria sp. FACHB-1406 TaxID=2692846 RepID=UPI0016867DEC|nr:thioredoxin family protein [Oscillatoria sp. FACHB-1406]MBD2580327.1 thioredoxin family protein [Oscillatoria sp. FACHB-1406]